MLNPFDLNLQDLINCSSTAKAIEKSSLQFNSSKSVFQRQPSSGELLDLFMDYCRHGTKKLLSTIESSYFNNSHSQFSGLSIASHIHIAWLKKFLVEAVTAKALMEVIYFPDFSENIIDKGHISIAPLDHLSAPMLAYSNNYVHGAKNGLKEALIASIRTGYHNHEAREIIAQEITNKHFNSILSIMQGEGSNNQKYQHIMTAYQQQTPITHWLPSQWSLLPELEDMDLHFLHHPFYQMIKEEQLHQFQQQYRQLAINGNRRDFPDFYDIFNPPIISFETRRTLNNLFSEQQTYNFIDYEARKIERTGILFDPMASMAGHSPLVVWLNRQIEDIGFHCQHSCDANAPSVSVSQKEKSITINSFEHPFIRLLSYINEGSKILLQHHLPQDLTQLNDQIHGAWLIEAISQTLTLQAFTNLQTTPNYLIEAAEKTIAQQLLQYIENTIGISPYILNNVENSRADQYFTNGFLGFFDDAIKRQELAAQTLQSFTPQITVTPLGIANIATPLLNIIPPEICPDKAGIMLSLQSNPYYGYIDRLITTQAKNYLHLPQNIDAYQEAGWAIESELGNSRKLLQTFKMLPENIVDIRRRAFSI
ncbi:MAG: hypothetical protein ACOYK8_00325 [Alphaproteobacteria bacterium]